MPNDAPPPDQKRGILRTCYEVFVIVSGIFFGLFLAWELSLAFVNALPRASGFGDIYRFHCWLGAISFLAPLSALLGALAAVWLLRVARARDP
ncbi:MAG: hypothetical protein HYS12_25510 [Planctomycetes bacterium]|nr:hypothetical protein [Planctomycetota bacterium]